MEESSGQTLAYRASEFRVHRSEGILPCLSALCRVPDEPFLHAPSNAPFAPLMPLSCHWEPDLDRPRIRSEWLNRAFT
jgi:hypothetical protein